MQWAQRPPTSSSSQDSLLLLSSLCLLNISIMVCLGVGLFKFISLWIHGSSSIFISMSWIKIGKFLAIVSSILSLLLPLSVLLHILHTLVYLMVSHRSLRLCSHFLNLFSFCSSDLIISIIWYLSSLILLLAQICPWMNPSSDFFFTIVIFSSINSFFVSFLGFLSLYWYLHFIHILFSWLSPHVPLVLYL